MAEQIEKHVFLAFTDAVDGRSDEFNTWYDDVHVPEVLTVPGFVSARRFKLQSAQPAGLDGPRQGYLVVYEMEGEIEPIYERLAATLHLRRRTNSIAEEHSAVMYTLISESSAAGEKAPGANTG